MLKAKFIIKHIVILSVLAIAGSSFFVYPSASLATDGTQVQPEITIISPNGGETYQTGQTITIKWSQKNVDTVTIGYKSCDPGCLDWIEFGYSVDFNSTENSIQWTIPSHLRSGEYKIEIIGYHTGVGSTSDKSDTTFTIINNSDNTANNSSPQKITNPSQLPVQDAFKAVVKIRTYILDSEYDLVSIGEGSGVIVRSDGLLLTNQHVVGVEDSFDNSKVEAAYQICIPTNIASEPECLYEAELIAENKDLDLALLKIKPINGLSQAKSFAALTITNQTIDVNDEVTILGYPQIGGSTITITKGIISGKTNKYGTTWLKTDAVVSYGNSGGAAIDNQGKLIGLTTAAHSDLLSSLGYLISSPPIYQWVGKYLNQKPQPNNLSTKLIQLTKLQHQSKNTNTFTNPRPSFSITKPNTWQFDYSGENILSIKKPGDDNEGTVNIITFRFPFTPSLDHAEPFLRRVLTKSIANSLIDIVKKENVTINGQTAQKITTSVAGKIFYYYFFPHHEYLIGLQVYYGQNDTNKQEVEQIVNSIKLLPFSSSPDKLSSYSHTNPPFTLPAAEGWQIVKLNDKSKPVQILSQQLPDIYGAIFIDKTDAYSKNMNNEEWLNKKLQNIKELNQLLAPIDQVVEVVNSNPHFRLNSALTDVVLLEITTKVKTTGKVLDRQLDYFIKSGNFYINPGITAYTDNQSAYDQGKKSFNQLMQHFSLLNKSTVPVLNIRNLSLYNRLKGRILLKVEDKGKAYYVHPISKKSYYLGRPRDAFAIMREQGIGITNADLKKIPIGLTELSGDDQDGDGLPDMLEDAIGTDKTKPDSDGDGFDDKTEIENGYDPLSKGKRLNYDNNFARQQAGKIFLQVESRGEAWYINPTDNKRYFLGRPADAFNIMRRLSLGISNKDFDSLN